MDRQVQGPKTPKPDCQSHGTRLPARTKPIPNWTEFNV
jgi:hypothetical protein